MSKTGISYCDETWNVLAGCSSVSAACENCWACALAAGRLQHHPDYVGLTRRSEGGRLQWTGEVRLLPHRLEEPLHWREPRVVFVAPRGDLFHPDVPDEYIGKVWNKMYATPQHTFLVLTKRPERMQTWLHGCANGGGLGWITHNGQEPKGYRGGGSIVGADNCWPLPNVILGVTVENREQLWRLDVLRKTPAAKRWLSAEPLLEDLGDLRRYLEPQYDYYQDQPYLPPLDWVIVGGESGPKARPMHPTWVRDIRDQCQAAGVAFWFKQWGEWGLSTVFGTAFKRDAGQLVPFVVAASTDPKQVGRSGYRCTPSDASDDVRRLETLYRVGKKAAGRALDGRTWEERP